MKEHPIIFSAPIIKAILENRCTMTRRVIKPQPDEHENLIVGHYYPTLVDKDGEQYPGDEIFGAFTDDGEYAWKCPYGQVGGRLWVRETWAIRDCGHRVPLDKETWAEGFPIDRLEYIATDPAPIPPELVDDSKEPYWWNKRPSIFMPRWASRITLEITDIRVERLQEISLEDCKAEGIHGYTFARACLSNNPPDPRWQYIELWDSLNAKRGYSCKVNPFVWVISFIQANSQE